MKRLPVDLELVQVALEDRDGDGQWLLDRDTGEVLRLGEDGGDDDDLADRIDEDSERYTTIPYQGSEAGYRDMVDFVASVDDHRMRALLEVALNGAGAFRRFKDVLQEHPEERERWFAFQRERVDRRLRRWLETEGIEPADSEGN